MLIHLKTLIRPKAFDLETTDSTYAKFTVEPLERGYGTTLGNAMRRILLSSIPGSAVCGIRAEGALHEFTTLPDVVEDMATIILNVKGINLSCINEDEQVLRIDVEGPKRITAADITPVAGITILNPNQYIATVNEGGQIALELYTSSGRGYVLAEENKNEDDPADRIPIDSLYSPIRRVNYRVGTARVGRRTDYDKLTLEVWTDGSVGPEDAVAQAARVLIEHLGLISNLEDEPTPGSDEKEADEETKRVARLLNTQVEELELSVRSANCLRAAGISTLKEMVSKSEAEMLKFRNFGRKSLNELGDILTSMDLAWGMDVSRYDDVEVEEEAAGPLAEEF